MRRRLPSLSVAALLALSSVAMPALAANLPPPDAITQVRTAGAYRIGPQDMLDINVSQVEELSKPVQVDTGGKILLPLVGQMQAAGRTPSELSQDIAAALKQHYMKDPQVWSPSRRPRARRSPSTGPWDSRACTPWPGRRP